MFLCMFLLAFPVGTHVSAGVAKGEGITKSSYIGVGWDEDDQDVPK